MSFHLCFNFDTAYPIGQKSVSQSHVLILCPFIFVFIWYSVSHWSEVRQSITRFNLMSFHLCFNLIQRIPLVRSPSVLSHVLILCPFIFVLIWYNVSHWSEVRQSITRFNLMSFHLVLIWYSVSHWSDVRQSITRFNLMSFYLCFNLIQRIPLVRSPSVYHTF